MGLKKIISGGQTGTDIAGIDAAIEQGMSYGGWLPKGRKTENGPLDSRYTNLTEMPVGDYPERTEQNVKDADGTVIFTHGKLSGDSVLTNEYAVRHNKPLLHLDLDVLSELTAIESLIDWIYEQKIETLNVTGTRESKDEYIYDDVHSIIESIINIIRTAEILPKPQPPPAITPPLQETIVGAPQANDKEAPTGKEEVKVLNTPPREGTVVIPQNTQTPPSIQPSLQETVIATPQVIKKVVVTERQEKKGSDTSSASGFAPLIERLPKTVQKNLLYISLSILILTTALMIMPGVLKNHSSENTPTKSLPIPESRESKTAGFSSDSTPAAGRTPEPAPQNVSALPKVTNSTEQAAIRNLPSGTKTPADSQAELLKNNQDIKADNPSVVVNQPEKTENEQKGTPVSDSLNKTDSSYGDSNGTLQSLSDTSGETEKKQVPLKKEPSKHQSRCGSLYIKISLGKILDKAETDFLTHNCN